MLFVTKSQLMKFNDSLQKAFVNISNFLFKHDHLLSIVTSRDLMNDIESTTFKFTASIPYVVARFEKGEISCEL